MPTIKDVAILAGVSHGTVSNVLNGYRSVNSSIVKRVESAIKELGYQPNLKARSMRNSRTYCIGTVLPNITDNIYIRLYNGIERIARDSGYKITLYISNGSPETEKALLQHMQQERVDGAIILSCMPENTEAFDHLLKSGIELVFVRRKPAGIKELTFLGIDERQVIFNLTTSLMRHGWREITLMTGREEYSNERECNKGFCEAMADFRRSDQVHSKQHDSGDMIVHIVDEGKESAFRAAVQLLHNKTKPRALITTCPEYSKGIQAAIDMFSLNTSLVLSLDCDSWINNISRHSVIHISQQYYQLGEETMKKLLLLIEANDPRKAETIILTPQPIPPIPSPEKSKHAGQILPIGGKTLQILMLENASSVASELMKSVFSKETGIPVEINTLPYESMYDEIFNNYNMAHYDIMQINIPWIAEAIRRGLIIPLDDLLGKDNAIYSVFSPEILEQHGLFKGILYTIPFIIGTQLLFYRKDLFGDLRIRRLFYEKNKKPLEVPVTWKDYDQIAEFFTRTINSESPVPYGTTLGGFSSSYCFVPRLWERGLSLFWDYSRRSAKSFLANVEETLNEYVAAFDYADPEAKNWDQAEQANQFCRGNAAMMVIFQALFADHVYQHESNIYRENIGFAALPSRTSILGGWSLGISAGSTMVLQAKCFLDWVFRDINIIPYNILGGSIPSKSTFSSHEMREIYPWLASASDCVYATRHMIDSDVQWISQWEFECIAEDILKRLINKAIDSKTAIEEFLKRLNEIKNNFC